MGGRRKQNRKKARAAARRADDQGKGPSGQTIARVFDGGQTGRVTDIRDETDQDGQLTNQVMETRFDVPTPQSVRGLIKSIFVKRNVVVEREIGMRQHGRVRSDVLVIVPRPKARQIVGQISGLPVNDVQAKKLRSCGFTHLTITWIPKAVRHNLFESEEHQGVTFQERSYRLAFYRPKSGHHCRGDKGGQLVHEVTDELSVMQWLFENGLEGLWDSEYLASSGLLPMHDRERKHLMAVAAQMSTAFGVTVGAPKQEQFHRARAWARYQQMFGDQAKDRFEQTVIGQQVVGNFKSGTLDIQRFYYAPDMMTAVALYNFKGCRWIVEFDLNERKVNTETMPVDHHGRPTMAEERNFLEGTFFQEVDEPTFRSLTRGMGTAREAING